MGGIGIHGTNAPSSIYSLATHGCIRLHPDDIRLLFGWVSVGTRGRIIYEPVMLTRAGDRIFVEVHPDAYRNGDDPLQALLEAARATGVLDLIDFELVTEAVHKQDGIARDVSRIK
jgi:L,D-transpeptidase ErfK/SrfK